LSMERAMSFACYCLVSEKGTTYVGFSVNVDRRLRQHNGEICGGAKATHGRLWKRMCTVAGFPSQQSALQFEWKWKYLSRKVKGGSAVERRCTALIELLNSDKSTSNALPFSTYDGPLHVLLEDPCVDSLRNKEMRHGIVIE
jgi:predicted GIY-YIG superfamily endonuclease